MLNLPKPTSWYFDICRQITWCRLTYDKLYILRSDSAEAELEDIWATAIIRCCGRFQFDSMLVLSPAIQSDDADWRNWISGIERLVDMRKAIDDYFLGVEKDVIVKSIDEGVYDV